MKTPPEICDAKVIDSQTLYFALDGPDYFFVECQVEFDEEKNKWILRGNDHILCEIGPP